MTKAKPLSAEATSTPRSLIVNKEVKMISGIGGGQGLFQLQQYTAMRGASGAMRGGAPPGAPPRSR